MGFMHFPLWVGHRQQMCRVGDTWLAEDNMLPINIPALGIRTVELPPTNLPVLWKPPLPVSPMLPKWTPSLTTAKYFGPQLDVKARKPKTLFGPVRSLTVEDVRQDLGLNDDWDGSMPVPGDDDWDIASGEIVTTPTPRKPFTVVESAEDVPDKRRFTVERHPRWSSDDVAGQDEFPWYVEEITFGDDRDDYSRAVTHRGAMALVGRMLNGERFAESVTAQAS